MKKLCGEELYVLLFLIWKKVLYKLKTIIQLLAIRNNFSMNKMFIYLLELGYKFYVERFEKENEIKMKGGHNCDY